MQIDAERQHGYFIWQFFLPLFLIIATSWILFWITDFGNQLNTAFTLMLAVTCRWLFPAGFLVSMMIVKRSFFGHDRRDLGAAPSPARDLFDANTENDLSTSYTPPGFRGDT